MELRDKIGNTSEDEEDLESLRLAALQTLHKPPEQTESSLPPQRKHGPHMKTNAFNKKGRAGFHNAPSSRNPRNGTYSRVTTLISIPTTGPDEKETHDRKNTFSDDSTVPKLVLPQDRYCKAATSEERSQDSTDKFSRYNISDDSESESEFEEDTEESGSESPNKLERAGSLEALMQELESEIQGDQKPKHSEEKVKKNKKIKRSRNVQKEEQIDLEQELPKVTDEKVLKSDKAKRSNEDIDSEMIVDDGVNIQGTDSDKTEKVDVNICNSERRDMTSSGVLEVEEKKEKVEESKQRNRDSLREKMFKDDRMRGKRPRSRTPPRKRSPLRRASPFRNCSPDRHFNRDFYHERSNPNFQFEGPMYHNMPYSQPMPFHSPNHIPTFFDPYNPNIPQNYPPMPFNCPPSPPHLYNRPPSPYNPLLPPHNQYNRPPSPLKMNTEMLNTIAMAPLSPRSAAFVLQNREIVERRKKSPRRSYSRSPSPRRRSMSPRHREFSPSQKRWSRSPPKKMSRNTKSQSPKGRFSCRTSAERQKGNSPNRRSPISRKLSPSCRQSPNGRRTSPNPRKLSPNSRKLSPNSRKLSPNPRKLSPSLRKLSPNSRKPSPNSRKLSPNSRKLSPEARRFSPHLRRLSPSARDSSPVTRRLSPNSRKQSPNSRKVSPELQGRSVKDRLGSRPYSSVPASKIDSNKMEGESRIEADRKAEKEIGNEEKRIERDADRKMERRMDKHSRRSSDSISLSPSPERNQKIPALEASYTPTNSPKVDPVLEARRRKFESREIKPEGIIRLKRDDEESKANVLHDRKSSEPEVKSLKLDEKSKLVKLHDSEENHLRGDKEKNSDSDHSPFSEDNTQEDQLLNEEEIFDETIDTKVEDLFSDEESDDENEGRFKSNPKDEKRPVSILPFTKLLAPTSRSIKPEALDSRDAPRRRQAESRNRRSPDRWRDRTRSNEKERRNIRKVKRRSRSPIELDRNSKSKRSEKSDIQSLKMDSRSSKSDLSKTDSSLKSNVKSEVAPNKTDSSLLKPEVKTSKRDVEKGSGSRSIESSNAREQTKSDYKVDKDSQNDKSEGRSEKVRNRGKSESKKDRVTSPIENKKIEIKIRNPGKYKSGEDAGKGKTSRKVEVAKGSDDEPKVIIDNEDDPEFVNTSEGDLRAQLSRKRAERQNKHPQLADIQSRLLQNALKGAVFKSSKKSKRSKERSEAPTDGKLPIHLRLGKNRKKHNGSPEQV